jgi:protease PrsW
VLVLGGGAGFLGFAFVLSSIRRWLINPEHNPAAILVPVAAISIVIGIALLIATTAIYIFGRNRIRTTSEGFSSAPGPG